METNEAWILPLWRWNNRNGRLGFVGYGAAGSRC